MKKAELIAKGDDILEQYVVDAEYSKYYDNELREAYDHEQSAALAAQEKGIQLGKEEGIQLGITKGRSEERTDIIQNMLVQKFSPKIISKCTKLSIEEVEKIIENLNDN